METGATRTPEAFFDNQPYGRLLLRESDGGFSAEILEFPGCIAEGDTADEAVTKLEENAKGWIESELAAGHGIPEPVCGDMYSGRLVARLPRSLHRAIAMKAARDRSSINQQIISAVASWVGADDAFRAVSEHLRHLPYTVFVMHAMSGAGLFAMQQRFHTSAETAEQVPFLLDSRD